MGILSPVMSYIVDKEVGFPMPSEKEKISKVLSRYNRILAQNPHRSDAPELMFGIADLLVGRGNPGDYAEAMSLFAQVLHKNIPQSLKARAIVGKAELMIGNPDDFDNAISLCEKARSVLGSDLSEFFATKTYLVEAELLIARNNEGDWNKALKLLNQVAKEEGAHWYFRGRAILSIAEITLYKKPKEITKVLKLCDSVLKEFKSRPDDYFAIKGRILKAEVLTRRGKGGDFFRAEKLLVEVIKNSSGYKDLVARAKLDLADIAHHPRAIKLLDEVVQMEGLDPYLVEKASIIEQSLEDKKNALKPKKKVKIKKKAKTTKKKVKKIKKKTKPKKKKGKKK
jgi:tetratricopeptide (TPR) repeat protein